jgi:hypothetical protein
MRAFINSDLPDDEEIYDDKITDLIHNKNYREKIFKVNLPFSRT